MLQTVLQIGDEMQVIVRAGDVVVAVTDGVADNLFISHIQELIAGHLRGLAADEPAECTTALSALASKLAEVAAAIGSRESDRSTRTPFAEAARAEGIVGLEGGKLDDCAVVCGVVRDQADTPAELGSALLPLNNFIK